MCFFVFLKFPMSFDYCVNVFKKILKKYPRDRLCNFVLINDNPCGRAIVIQNLRVFFGALFARGDLYVVALITLLESTGPAKCTHMIQNFQKSLEKTVVVF